MIPHLKTSDILVIAFGVYAVLGFVSIISDTASGYAANQNRFAYLLMRSLLWPLWLVRWIVRSIIAMVKFIVLGIIQFLKDCWNEFGNIWRSK